LIRQGSSLLRNAATNTIAQACGTALQVLFVPIFIRFLGIEGYGLLAIQSSIIAIAKIFDSGLSIIVIRELTGDKSNNERLSNLGALLARFRRTYAALAIIYAALLFALANPLASHWVSDSSFTQVEMSGFIRLMAITASLQSFTGFYYSCLLGLEKQVIYSMLRLFENALVYIGGFQVITHIDSDIGTLLFFQALSASISLATAVIVTRGLLPTRIMQEKAGLYTYRSSRAFTKGALAISVCTLVLTQFDKLSISYFMDIKAVGTYAFAFFCSSSLSSFITIPLFNAFYPRLSVLASAKASHKEMLNTISFGSQLMACLIGTSLSTLSIFCFRFMLIIFDGSDTAIASSTIIRITAIGAILNATASIPYALQLAVGRTDIALKCNIAASVTSILLYSLTIPAFGMSGAAIAWSASMLIYFVLSFFLTNSLIEDIGLRWLIYDTLLPLTIGAMCVAVLSFLVWQWLPQSIVYLGVAAFASVAAGLIGSSMFASHIRDHIAARIRGIAR
jgi:O-antigen/teichoic acid export membrane protein